MSSIQTPKTTVVLTSCENFVWHSMQEIIPSIEKNWLDTKQEGVHEVHRVDVDKVPLREMLPLLLRAQNIVITCFTTRICATVAFLKKDTGIDARFFVYLHNQATIACWPFHVFCLAKCLSTRDVFVSSCRLDADTLSHSFEKYRVETIPFTLPHIRDLASASASPNAVPLVYVGRISVQKNLHTLIYALHLLKKKGPSRDFRLNIYGKEDDLGSPNMGMQFDHYEAYLKDLVASLGLIDRITFKGHLDREDLYHELGDVKHVFVSPSLHSDENFGMAAFRSLCLGNQAVLSRWGGHEGFEADFAGQLRLVDVKESPSGPFVDSGEFANALSLAIETYTDTLSARIPERFQEKIISSRLLELALENFEKGEPLKPTPLAATIIEKRERYLEHSPKKCKIFTSYSDPDSIPFFRGYGMKKSTPQPLVGGAEILIPPWVAAGQDLIEVHDPHRGSLILRVGSEAREIQLVDPLGRKHATTREAATKLLALGYACR